MQRQVAGGAVVEIGVELVAGFADEERIGFGLDGDEVIVLQILRAFDPGPFWRGAGNVLEGLRGIATLCALDLEPGEIGAGLLDGGADGEFERDGR